MNELTREMILAMPAGREMDALVAERVMGLPFVHRYQGEWLHTRNPMPFAGAPIVEYFSTDIAAAWEVVEKLPNSSWVEIRWDGKVAEAWFDDGARTWEAQAETAPLAICRAALLATLEDI